MCAWQLCTQGPSLAAWPESMSWTGRWPCTDASPNLTVPKLLLSRKSHLCALLSQQLSHSFLSLHTPHCLSSPLWQFQLFLKPWTCSSHQKPSLFLLRGDLLPLQHWKYREGEVSGRRMKPVTLLSFPLPQKDPPLSMVQQLKWPYSSGSRSGGGVCKVHFDLMLSRNDQMLCTDIC